MTDPRMSQPPPAATPERTPEPATGAPPEPGERPTGVTRAGTERRLDTPPSQRYVMAARGETDQGGERSGPSLALGALIGGIVAVFIAGVMVVLGGVFTFTAGLIVAAGFLGRLTALGVNSGAADAGSPAARRAIAVGLSLGGVAVAQVGLWLWAGFEGGTLDLLDFLGRVYEALVPLQFLLAGGIAWLSAR